MKKQNYIFLTSMNLKVVISLLNLKIKIHKSTDLSSVLCGYQTWHLSLKQEDGMRIIQNGVLL